MCDVCLLLSNARFSLLQKLPTDNPVPQMGRCTRGQFFPGEGRLKYLPLFPILSLWVWGRAKLVFGGCRFSGPLSPVVVAQLQPNNKNLKCCDTVRVNMQKSTSLSAAYSNCDICIFRLCSSFNDGFQFIVCDEQHPVIRFKYLAALTIDFFIFLGCWN